MFAFLSNKKLHPFLYVLLAASLISLFLSFFVWSNYYSSVYKIQKFGMDVYVINELGFDVSSEAMHFGHVPPGARALKHVNISVNDIRTLVTIETEGNISQFVYVSDNDFIMEPHETRKIEVTAAIPNNTKINSYYNGIMTVILRKI